MSREHGDTVERIEWGTFRVLRKRHGKTERGKVGIGKDIRVIGVTYSALIREGHRGAFS